jgi:hypothetical protein
MPPTSARMSVPFFNASMNLSPAQNQLHLCPAASQGLDHASWSRIFIQNGVYIYESSLSVNGVRAGETRGRRVRQRKKGGVCPPEHFAFC